MKLINDKYHDLSKYQTIFKDAKPFPYLVLDDFISPKAYSYLSELLAKESNLRLGKSFSSIVEAEKSISLNVDLPQGIAAIVNELNSEEWINNLRSLTNISDLDGTNCGNTHLANYHEMSMNGILGSHVDHSHEQELAVPHVFNIVLYLTPNWDARYGGRTQLYDRKGKKIISEVDYVANRAVLFLHTPYSFHGVSKISGNLGVTRKTLYVDYYSKSLNPYKEYIFDFPNIWFKHGTTFKFNHFYDYFKIKNSKYVKTLLAYECKRIISQIVNVNK